MNRREVQRLLPAAVRKGIAVHPLAYQRSDLFYGWCGPSLFAIGSDGWCGSQQLSGYYFRQVRYLHELRVTVNGEEPFLCSIAQAAPNRLESTYIVPEVNRGGGGGSGSGGSSSRNGIVLRGIDIRMLYEVHPASVDVTILLSNRFQPNADVELSVFVDADFATMDEAQFQDLPRITLTSAAEASSLKLHAARNGQAIETVIAAREGDWSVGEGYLKSSVRITRQETMSLRLSITARDLVDEIDQRAAGIREQKLEYWYRHAAVVEAPGESPLIDITNRAMRDLGSLALLEGAPDEWLTPAAGAPLYMALWGRDALTAAWQAGMFDGGMMLADVITTLGRLQGTRVDPSRDEAPGRIINQAKRDPISRTSTHGFGRAYQDVASPMMYIIGFGHHYALTGDKAFVRKHWDTALRVMEWADKHGDRDGDGYLEYLTEAPDGPTHQGWKDSENAVVRRDGSPVPPPIAACEIQGYWYVALQFMAALSVVMRERERAREFWEKARKLSEQFNRDFWLDDEEFFAFGLDAAKEPIRVVTSNACQCLATGIIARKRTPQVVRRMFQPDLFSGWGIRTLSTNNPSYNPLDYHLGSVWPVENASILFGLRRYGFEDQTHELSRALYDLARLWPGGQVPECVGGYARNELSHPGVYPRANRPQLWNQSVWPLLIQCLLGLVPYAPLRLLMVDPILPSWLPEITVRGIRVGNARVDLRFWRDDGGRSHYDVIDKQGKVRIIKQPWLESMSANAFERLAGLAESVLHH